MNRKHGFSERNGISDGIIPTEPPLYYQGNGAA